MGKFNFVPLTTRNANGQLVETDFAQFVMHGDSKWLEWNDRLVSSQVAGPNGDLVTVFEGGWEQHSGDPLVMTFETKESAQNFADQLLGLTQLLAPMMGMFSQENFKSVIYRSIKFKLGRATILYFAGSSTFKCTRIW